MLTIAYITCRKRPMLEWFFQSLHREVGGDYSALEILVIDLHRDAPGRIDAVAGIFRGPPSHLSHIAPKPTVWQGPHRLTKQDFFAASNARNTALCAARYDTIAYVDDVSILCPGWYARVLYAANEGRVTCGAYSKGKGMIVGHDGQLISASSFDHDTRGAGSGYRTIGGGQLYGSSVVMPVQTLLRINGWDEDCDSMGAEDYTCGLMLEGSGVTCYYDPAMKTIESDDHHGGGLLRIDKKNVHGHRDASHAMLHMVTTDRRIAPNYQDMAATREEYKYTKTFPAISSPQHDWRDGQPLSEMG